MKGHLNMLNNEISILKQLDHPNIIKFFEIYEDKCNIHFVSEYCSGGELLDMIVNKGRLNEKQATIYMM